MFISINPTAIPHPSLLLQLAKNHSTNSTNRFTVHVRLHWKIGYNFIILHNSKKKMIKELFLTSLIISNNTTKAKLIDVY